MKKVFINQDLITLTNDEKQVWATHPDKDFVVKFSGIEARIFELLQSIDDLDRLESELETKYEFEGTPLKTFLISFFKRLEKISFVRTE